MKKMILAVLVAASMLALSGCGDDNNLPLIPTKATITFASMSTAIGAPGAWSNGIGNAAFLASVPSYCNISSTATNLPTTGKTGAFLPTSLDVPPGAKQISASVLKKAGLFANNTSVSKRTKIVGFYTTNTLEPIKEVTVYMVYSTAAVAPKVVRAGDVAALTVTAPLGKSLNEDMFKQMNNTIWGFFGTFFFETPVTALDLNAVPTISSVVLGF